jgi:hypothetical protein
MWFLFVILTVFKLFQLSCCLDGADDSKQVSPKDDADFGAFDLDASEKVLTEKSTDFMAFESRDGYATHDTDASPLTPVLVYPSTNMIQCNFDGNFMVSFSISSEPLIENFKISGKLLLRKAKLFKR